jgi:hypothetical protein
MSASAATPSIDAGAPTPRRVVEIRSYRLVEGARGRFHQLVVNESIPLLREFEIDVVAYGPSLADDRAYYLIRAFASLADRARAEDVFYGSAAWRDGPRQAILELIDSYVTVTVELDASGVDALRRREPEPDADQVDFTTVR